CAFHAVDEIAGAQRGDGALARGRGDGGVGRRALAELLAEAVRPALAAAVAIRPFRWLAHGRRFIQLARARGAPRAAPGHTARGRAAGAARRGVDEDLAATRAEPHERAHDPEPLYLIRHEVIFPRMRGG